MFRVWDIQFTQNLYPNWFVYLTIASSVISLGLYRFGATVPLVHDQSMAATIAVMAVVALAPLKIAYFLSHQCPMSIPILYIHSHSISLFLLRTFYFNNLQQPAVGAQASTQKFLFAGVCMTSAEITIILLYIMLAWGLFILPLELMQWLYSRNVNNTLKIKTSHDLLVDAKKKKWPNQSVCWTNKCSSSSFS